MSRSTLRNPWQHFRAAFERELATLPSAARGHAIEFFCDHDPTRAVELARANFETRPGHEARVLLAKAHWANGAPKTAWDTLAPLATELRDGPTWMTAPKSDRKMRQLRSL